MPYVKRTSAMMKLSEQAKAKGLTLALPIFKEAGEGENESVIVIDLETHSTLFRGPVKQARKFVAAWVGNKE